MKDHAVQHGHTAGMEWKVQWWIRGMMLKEEMVGKKETWQVQKKTDYTKIRWTRRAFPPFSWNSSPKPGETWFTSLVALCQQIHVKSTYKNSHQFSMLGKPHSSSESSSDTHFCVVEILCWKPMCVSIWCFVLESRDSVFRSFGVSKIKKCI